MRIAGVAEKTMLNEHEKKKGLEQKKFLAKIKDGENEMNDLVK